MDSKATAVLDILHSKVYSWGASQTVPQWRWHHVESVAVMEERASKADIHYADPAPSLTHGNQTLENCTVSLPVEPTVVRGLRGLK